MANETHWPSYPSVTLGAGGWQHVLKVLRRDGTVRSADLAKRIDGQIEETARRIAQRVSGGAQ